VHRSKWVVEGGGWCGAGQLGARCVPAGLALLGSSAAACITRLPATLRQQLSLRGLCAWEEVCDMLGCLFA
jgi:hypothetical protein